MKKLTRLIFLTVSLLCGSFFSHAQIPAGYYDAANGLSGQELKTALHNIIDDHTVKSYDYLWTAFETTDDNASGKVLDMYSNCDFTFISDQCGDISTECDCYNREHSFPASWFSDAYPMYSDLFHLAPTDGKVNQIRSNTIYSDYQYNRNPFIDHPEYVEAIWGDGFAPEPTNHASDFSAHCITLNWTDAADATLPHAYLVRMSSSGFEAITTPVDGAAIDDDFSNKNINYGVQKAIFGGLTPGNLYYFKIYGYVGSGAGIDYKTDGSVQQVSIEAR